MVVWSLALKLAVVATSLVLGGGSGYTTAGTNHKTSPHGDNHLPYIFQHVGKAGGGTIGERIKAYGLVDWFSVCHPGPCLTPEVAASHEGMLVNIRDPVDRFVSAFDWRHVILCDPEHADSRPHGSGFAPGKDPTLSCAKKDPKEAAMLTDRYHGDANELAEALCAKGSLAAKLADDDLKKIGHAQYPLIQHLGGAALFERLVATNASTGPGGSPRFTIIVTPLERGYDFVNQVNAACNRFSTTLAVAAIETPRRCVKPAPTLTDHD